MASFRDIDVEATLIDLGDRVEPPQTIPIRWREQVGRRRIGLLAVAAVAVLGLVVASATPPIDPFPKAASLPIGSNAHVLIQGDRALIVDTRGKGSEISSYALPGGRRIWSSPIGGSAENSDAMVNGSTVVVQSLRSNGQNELVEAFDLANGRKLWTRQAFGAFTTTVGLLIEAPADRGSGSHVDLIDSSTGRTVWTMPVPDTCTIGLGDPSSALIELCPADQRMTAVDLRTGLITAVAYLHLPVHQGQRDSRPQLPTLLFVGDVIIVSVNDSPDLYAAGFHAGDLMPLWSGLPMTADVNVEICAPAVCAINARGAVIQLDPTNGEVISESSGVITSNDPFNEAPTTGGNDTSSSAVQPAAGITELVVVPPSQVPTVEAPALGVDFQQALPAGVAVAVRAPAPVAAARMWVTRQVITGTGVVLQRIGLLRHVSDACLVISTYLVCTTARDQISLWRLP